MDYRLFAVEHPCISKGVLICEDLQGTLRSGNAVFKSPVIAIFLMVWSVPRESVAFLTLTVFEAWVNPHGFGGWVKEIIVGNW